MKDASALKVATLKDASPLKVVDLKYAAALKVAAPKSALVVNLEFSNDSSSGNHTPRKSKSSFPSFLSSAGSKSALFSLLGK